MKRLILALLLLCTSVSSAEYDYARDYAKECRVMWLKADALEREIAPMLSYLNDPRAIADLREEHKKKVKEFNESAVSVCHSLVTKLMKLEEERDKFRNRLEMLCINSQNRQDVMCEGVR